MTSACRELVRVSRRIWHDKFQSSLEASLRFFIPRARERLSLIHYSYDKRIRRQPLYRNETTMFRLSVVIVRHRHCTTRKHAYVCTELGFVSSLEAVSRPVLTAIFSESRYAAQQEDYVD